MVVIHNANYNSGADVVKNVVEKLSKSKQAILSILRTDQSISAEAIAVEIGKTQRTVQRLLAGLKEKGYKSVSAQTAAAHEKLLSNQIAEDILLSYKSIEEKSNDYRNTKK